MRLRFAPQFLKHDASGKGFVAIDGRVQAVRPAPDFKGELAIKAFLEKADGKIVTKEFGLSVSHRLPPDGSVPRDLHGSYALYFSVFSS